MEKREKVNLLFIATMICFSVVFFVLSCSTTNPYKIALYLSIGSFIPVIIVAIVSLISWYRDRT